MKYLVPFVLIFLTFASVQAQSDSLTKTSAEFPGGNSNLPNYLAKELKQATTLAAKKQIEGIMVVHFFVNETGQVMNVEVTKSVDPEIDQMVKEKFLDMPLWTPATENGKAVKSDFSIPLYFSFED